MKIRRRTYGFHVTLLRGVDYMTHEDLLIAVQRSKVRYEVRPEDHTYTSLTFGVLPNWNLSKVERTSKVLIVEK